MLSTLINKTDSIRLWIMFYQTIVSIVSIIPVESTIWMRYDDLLQGDWIFGVLYILFYPK